MFKCGVGDPVPRLIEVYVSTSAQLDEGILDELAVDTDGVSSVAVTRGEAQDLVTFEVDDDLGPEEEGNLRAAAAVIIAPPVDLPTLVEQLRAQVDDLSGRIQTLEQGQA